MAIESVSEQYDYIIKSENDARSYRGLIFNQMKVLLISDPTTEQASAALDVNIGTIADPNHMRGLAQLLQRVLYKTTLSTQQTDFKTYVRQNGGTVECEMNEEDSNYYFDVPVTEFKDALKMFATLFTTSHAFSEDLIISEIEIMSNENDLTRVPNGTNNTEALTQLFKWIINYHPMSQRGHNFTNQQTSNIVNNLEKFYHNFYYAHIMSLCVLSRESLDDLKEWVIESFSAVRRKDATNIPYMKMQRLRAPPVTSVYKIWCAPYNRDTPYTNLHVIFPTEKFNYYRYTTALQHFLAYLFKYDGKGSLLSVLRTKGWGYLIEAKRLSTSKCCSFFSVAIDLTDEGLEHIDDILTLFIHYVKMLTEDDGSRLRRIYNEYKEIMELKFHFEKKKSLKDVKIISKNLQYITQNMKDILCLKYIPIVNSGRIIKNVMNDFLSQPLRMRICIIAEKYKNCIEEEEPWYRYRYKKEMVSVKTYANWWNNPCATLNLPACNEFIPTRFNVKPYEDNAEKRSPTIIWNTQFVRLWHKKDNEFDEPRAIMNFHFISPPAYANSFNVNLTHLFIQLINNSLNEYLYAAALVGLYWKFHVTAYGLQLDIFGNDDKQYILLEKIVDRMMNFQLSPENFEINRQNHIQSCAMQLEQLKNQDIYKQANYYLSLLRNNSWSRDQVLIPINDITFETVQQFISDLFNSMYVECLIYGNITRAEALNIAHLIDNKLSHVIPLTITHLEMHDDIKSARHNIKCDKGKGNCLIYIGENMFSKSFVVLFYQINERSTRSYILLNLIQQIIYTPLNTLREKKKLSDKVDTGAHRENKIQGLKILTECLKQHKYQMISQIINFMNNDMKEYINEMSEEEFQKNKQLLADSYDKEKPKTFYDVSAAFWAEILNQEYNFDQTHNDELNYLHQIMKNDLCTFFEKLLDLNK